MKKQGAFFILVGATTFAASLAHAASAPTIRVWASEASCSGRTVRMIAEWEGNATNYELYYEGVKLASSTGPSAKAFQPGASEFTLTLKGCRAGVCRTVSNDIKAINCPAPPHSVEIDPDGDTHYEP